jgi:hypothetical protein
MSSSAPLPRLVDPQGSTFGDRLGIRNPHRKSFILKPLGANHPHRDNIEKRPPHGAQASRLWLFSRKRGASQIIDRHFSVIPHLPTRRAPSLPTGTSGVQMGSQIPIERASLSGRYEPIIPKGDNLIILPIPHDLPCACHANPKA